MRTSLRSLFVFVALACSLTAAAKPRPDGFVFVKGGSFKHTKSNYHGKGVTVSDFYIAKYEVTQKEWTAVMGGNPSEFRGENLPVEQVTWYDCIEYCNRRSLREGLKPCYTIDRSNKDPGNEHPDDPLKWTVTLNPGANGYRLPTEAEWEYAAGGGQLSRGHTYSGSDNIDSVAWYWVNSGDEILSGLWNWPLIQNNHNRTKPVGSKAPNELGIHDMSGNVREWCWDWHGELAGEGRDPRGRPSGPVRVWKGGGWLGGDFCCEPAYRGNFEPSGLGSDQGLRLCRDA